MDLQLIHFSTQNYIILTKKQVYSFEKREKCNIVKEKSMKMAVLFLKEYFEKKKKKEILSGALRNEKFSNIMILYLSIYLG